MQRRGASRRAAVCACLLLGLGLGVVGLAGGCADNVAGLAQQLESSMGSMASRFSCQQFLDTFMDGACDDTMKRFCAKACGACPTTTAPPPTTAPQVQLAPTRHRDSFFVWQQDAGQFTSTGKCRRVRRRPRKVSRIPVPHTYSAGTLTSATACRAHHAAMPARRLPFVQACQDDDASFRATMPMDVRG